VTWTDDPELQAMFMSELSERAARLVEGGQAMVAGEVDDDIMGTMLREGHTIKGTGRVMGFDAVSAAGQQLEMVWRRIQADELEASPELGEAVIAVASVLEAAGGGDPEHGTPELTEALRHLAEALGGPGGGKPKLRAVEPVDAEPSPADEQPIVERDQSVSEEVAPKEAIPEDPVPAVAESGDVESEEDLEPRRPRIRASTTDDVVDPEPYERKTRDDSSDGGSEFRHEHVRPRQEPISPPQPEPTPYEPPAPEVPAAASITADLGGLLGAVDSWASAETLAVGAGRMYRLINLAARIRIDMEEAESRMNNVRNSDDLESLERSFGAIVQASSELEHDAMQLAAIPLASMTNTLPQLVRFVAKKLGKEVRFEIMGDMEIVVDRQVLDKISDPLRQLVVNAITHGIETPEERSAAGKAPTGQVTLTAAIKDRRVEIVIADDGAGVDWNAVKVAALDKGLLSVEAASDPANLNDALFSDGFSTGAATDLGGAGKGLSEVSEVAESLFGRVRLESNTGNGTSVTMTVPTSRTLQRVMVFETAGMKWGIPEAVVEEVMPIDSAGIDWSGDVPTIDWRGQRISVSPLGDIVGAAESRLPKHIIIVSHRVGNAAVTVQAVHGVREVAAKELGPLLSGPSHITGAALLGGGDVVLVLEASALVTNSEGLPAQHQMPEAAPAARQRVDRILVVDDSIGARAVVSGALASSGFSTSVAASAAEALEILATEDVDALVVDFSMPQEDGAELVSKIRGRGLVMPIVMLSGVATEEDKARSKNAGVDVFFDKADFREGALAETLREMLGRG